MECDATRMSILSDNLALPTIQLLGDFSASRLSDGSYYVLNIKILNEYNFMILIQFLSVIVNVKQLIHRQFRDDDQH